jgi:hypothetical protein
VTAFKLENGLRISADFQKNPLNPRSISGWPFASSHKIGYDQWRLPSTTTPFEEREK